MSDPRHELGVRAEEAVATWLETGCGWRVMARRWRCASGELDLVCVDRAGILVGVEVRARRGRRVGIPEESIDRIRLRRLRQTLASYAAACGESYHGLRVDLVAVGPSPTDRSRYRVRRLPGVDAW